MEAPNLPTPSHTMPTTQPTSSRSGWLLLSLIMLVICAVGTALYAQRTATSMQILIRGNQALTIQLQRLQNLQAVLTQRVDQQQMQLAHYAQLTANKQPAWLFAEINYLVRLANYNLNYTHDIAAAIVLLETADQRVLQLNNSHLNLMRQPLANNITLLQAADKLDKVGILTQLAALQVQVDTLPLIAPPAFTLTKQSNSTMAKPTVTFWRQTWENSLATLRALVIIRHHHAPVEPLLDAEQLRFLQQNLKLQLQQAQWAVLQNNPAIYALSLTAASKQIQYYFASASSQTTAFLQNLQRLQKINIRPAVPDLSVLLESITTIERTANLKNAEGA